MERVAAQVGVQADVEVIVATARVHEHASHLVTRNLL
jgi:hypothetical protein